MLLSLKVKDFGIIDEMQWHPEPGLNVITGETGAGKSLVIEAVESLLTGKLDEEAIRTGANEARIEGVFALSGNTNSAPVKELLADKGIPADGTLVIGHELRKQGRSVSRVNGSAVPRGILQQITRYLVDIHGQSEHQSLLNRKYHLDFLDAYARNLDLRRNFSTRVAELGRAEQELKTLVESEKDIARRQELLHFQIDDIKKARLDEGEPEELANLRARLSSCEKLKSLSSEAYHLLYGGDPSRGVVSAAGMLGEATGLMKKLVEIDPSLKPHLDYLMDTSFGLEETVRAIRAYSEGLEYDPRRLEETESRLELIGNLKRKYGTTVREIHDFQKRSEQELESLVQSSERRIELEAGCARLKAEMGQIATELSSARSGAAGKLIAEVKKELHDLQMAQVDFAVAITQSEAHDGLPVPGGKVYAFGSDGIDTVEFMVSANPGEPLKPLVKTASTGELSRFMLALKGALSQADNIPVLIFDEIDIGVGGRSGEIVGQKLWLLSRGRQIVCVTHLPQIAAFADAHYRIQKGLYGTRTLSTLEVLEDKGRTEELAVMLSGAPYTAISLKNAQEMVQKAIKWKSSHGKG